MTAPAYDVLIIGAGFTGTALAIQLARRLPPQSRVLLVGTPKATGRGLAYGTDNPEHLLNVRAERMSLFPDDPGHFVRWLERHEPGGVARRSVADSYAPRLLYGRYVRDCLHQAIAEARSRVRVEVLEGTVTDLQKSERGYLIRTASGQHYQARAATLCLGNGQPDFPFDTHSIAAAAHEHLIADPWSDYRMRTILPDQRVLFVGTGLTMVDQALALERAGHAGGLVAISRHGLLPASHLPTRTDPCSIAIPRGKVTLQRLLRLVVEAARDEVAAGRDWRSVIDGLRPQTQELWQRLDREDRRRFFRHLAALWSVHRHRMAAEVAERVERLRTDRRLTVAAGRVLTIRHAPGGVTVAFRRRGGPTVELLPFDWVVNCSGTDRASSGEAEPVLRQVVGLGLARAGFSGRGLDVEADGAVIGRTGRPTTGLYALGPLTVARFLEITAVPEIRLQCVTVAGALADFVAEGKRAVEFYRGRIASSSVR
jgi:uncharacterized NAD(P)/FAD-binding protein YdhS